MRLVWTHREAPLPPQGVLGHGEVARTLGRRVLARHSSAWDVLATDDLLVVLGDDLPWADGVTYLGKCPVISGLWWPTTHVTQVHPAIIAQRIRRTTPLPAALTPGCLIALHEARPADPEHLRAWLS